TATPDLEESREGPRLEWAYRLCHLRSYWWRRAFGGRFPGLRALPTGWSRYRASDRMPPLRTVNSHDGATHAEPLRKRRSWPKYPGSAATCAFSGQPGRPGQVDLPAHTARSADVVIRT